MNQRTDEELNRIIAEWLKPKLSCDRIGGCLHNINPTYSCICDELVIEEYSADLNAMHEAEKKLTRSQPYEYASILGDIVEIHDDYYDGIVFSEASKLTFATARQRAEALVAVIEGEKQE